MEFTLLKKKSRKGKKDEIEQIKPAAGRKGGGKKKLFTVIAVVVVIIAVVFFLASRLGGNKSNTTSAYTTEKVELRNITKELSGSGALEAADSYSVTTLLEGEILNAPFEEGQIVQKDSVLYTIDSSDVSNSVEKAQISIDQSQRTYETDQKNEQKLTITAPISGTVTSTTVDVGDNVVVGQTVAKMYVSNIMCLKVYFPTDDAAGFYVGENATVTLDGSFEILPATVSEVSDADTSLTGNMIVREVKLDVKNPGGISTTQVATATVNGVGSNSNNTFTYKEEKTITAEAAGKVSQVTVSNGAQVDKGKTLIVLKSDTLDNQVKSDAESVRTARLTLENQQKQLDDYSITSPISGTIIDKNYKVGDTVESGKVLCTIYDMSFLTMTLDVDELDVANVSVGQEVSITADAVKGKSYAGVITKVSVAGTTKSGVTTYPVTIRIDEAAGLMPGMNVDAKIVIKQVENVLSIPSDALIRDNMVLITADSPSANTALSDQAPEGYVYVAVTAGISDDSYVQILSGLTENDVVGYKKPVTSSTTSSFGPPSNMGSSDSGAAGQSSSKTGA